MGRRLAGMIRAYAKLSAGRMLWADRTSVDGGDYLLATSTAPLTIVSVAGVKTPQSPDRATWTTEEARSVALLAGAAKLASAHIWRDLKPKAFMVDEATVLLSGSSAFQGLVNRGALDSRKYACAFIVAMHLADTLSSVGAHAMSLFGAAALFRTAAAVEAALSETPA